MTPEATPVTASTDNLGGNLWPELTGVPKQKPPVTILKEQAVFLGQRTKNILVGEVRPADKDTTDNLAFTFSIVAPALSNYRLPLFQIGYKLSEMYPVSIHQIYTEVFDFLPAHDEKEFREALSQIFSDHKTLKAIQALLVQSEGFALPAMKP